MMGQEDPDLHRDWSLLPPDLIGSILGALELPDLFASAAVCRAWRTAYKDDSRLDPAPFFRGPCLAFSCFPGSKVTLRSLTNGGRVRCVTLPDPPFATRYVMGSSHGWLVTADEKSDLLLVNPATRAQVSLPPIRTLSYVKSYFKRGVLQMYRVHDVELGGRLRHPPSDFNHHVRKYTYEYLQPSDGRLSFYKKVVMSSDPTSGNCVVMIIHEFNDTISFARVGDARWKLLDAATCCRDYVDLHYSGEDGLFYAIRDNSEVHTIDLSGPYPVVDVVFRASVPPPEDDGKYIVRAPWGDVLQVSWYDDYPDMEALKAVVYKMDFVGKKFVETKSLRGYALFIGFNSSFFFLPNKDCSVRVKANCVYHADDLIDGEYLHRIYAPRRMVEINLEDGSVNDVWPSPNWWSNWPPPVWLTPTFLQEDEVFAVTWR